MSRFAIRQAGKNLAILAAEGAFVNSETKASVTADAEKMVATGIIPANK